MHKCRDEHKTVIWARKEVHVTIILELTSGNYVTIRVVGRENKRLMEWEGSTTRRYQKHVLGKSATLRNSK